MEKLSSFGRSWGGCASLLSVAIAFAAFLGFGALFYNQVWQSKVLTYTILPSYDLGDQSFSGIVIENRGQVPLTNVQIIFSDFPEEIIKINMPGAHEPAVVVNGGVGSKEATIRMEVFSKGASLSVYVVTTGKVPLSEKGTFFISSEETAGVPSGSRQDDVLTRIISTLGVGFGIITSFLAIYGLVQRMLAGGDTSARDHWWGGGL